MCTQECWGVERWWDRLRTGVSPVRGIAGYCGGNGPGVSEFLWERGKPLISSLLTRSALGKSCLHGCIF